MESNSPSLHQTQGDSDSRAGLVWEAEADEPYFREVGALEPTRWGVWGVGTTEPLRAESDARPFLASLLHELRPRWEAWKAAQENA